MRLLVNAIITGFGLKLGADIYKAVKKKLGLPDDDSDNKVVPVDPAAQS
ncbi:MULTISPECIES: hypothetical protein [Nannocystis]|uniref:Uncharacterized protein n=1 Tax=Nannocystis radixulma TaxID=2995305 RepID=A0ABT5B6Q9_9BACT|nr:MULTISPECIES: hypothetical protein [Nannocystis]MCY1055920.1 hypothetical protein [Nannocystis sp. SCPEA4]MDC0668767.1 hypothetical protein [Nannocystis radixulma]